MNLTSNEIPLDPCFHFYDRTTFIDRLVGYGQENPVIESVNLDNNGDVTIQWNNPHRKRQVYYLPLGLFSPVEAGCFSRDYNNRRICAEFVDLNSGADQKKQIYRINLEGNEIYESEEMQTMFLEENIVYDECALTNTFRWTGFFPTFSPIDYKISTSTDGGVNFIEIETIAASDLVPVEQISTYENASPAQTNVYEYTHRNLDPDNIYIYKNRAVYSVENLPQSSSSNQQSRNTPAYERPDAPVISRISVERRRLK